MLIRVAAIKEHGKVTSDAEDVAKVGCLCAACGMVQWDPCWKTKGRALRTFKLALS